MSEVKPVDALYEKYAVARTEHEKVRSKIAEAIRIVSGENADPTVLSSAITALSQGRQEEAVDALVGKDAQSEVKAATQSKLKALEDKPVMKELRDTYETMRGLEGEIWEQAHNMGGHFWTAEERTYFHNPAQKEVHAQNWDSLPGTVRSALRNYDPTIGVKFSAYLMKSLQLKTSQHYDQLNGEEETPRRQRLRTTQLSQFPVDDAERPATAQGAENSLLEAELTREITARLSILARTDPISMRLYIDHHIGDKKLRELSEENDVTKQAVQHRIGKEGDKIQQLLGSLYAEHVVDEHPSNVADNERTFARALYSALRQVKEEIPPDAPHAANVKKGRAKKSTATRDVD